MAVYENLPVFKLSYDLILYMYKICANLNRLYRYNLGERIEAELKELMLDIYRANDHENKIPFLQAAKERIVSVKLYVRLLYDSGQISLKKFTYISEQMESVSKQLSAWCKKNENKSKKYNLYKHERQSDYPESVRPEEDRTESDM